MDMSHSDWILQNSLLQAFHVDLCGISKLILQSLYYSREVDCFGFQVGMESDDRLFANARYMIVKFLCQIPY